MGKKFQKTSDWGCLKFWVTKQVCIKCGQVSQRLRWNLEMLWRCSVENQKSHLKTLAITACILWCVKAGTPVRKESVSILFCCFTKKVSICLMGLEGFGIHLTGLHGTLRIWVNEIDRSLLCINFLKGCFSHSNFYSICVNKCLVKRSISVLQFNCTASLKQLKPILRAMTTSGIDLRKL